METYWVPDLTNVSFFWCSILILFSDAFLPDLASISMCQVDHLSWCNFSKLKSTKILKTTGRTEKESVAMGTKFNFICKCVTFGTMSVSSFNVFCRKLIEIAPFMYSMFNWFE